jgi:two-component system response regulator FixJ
MLDNQLRTEVSAVSPPPHDPVAHGRRPVYVIDDDEAVRNSLGILLETHGFAVSPHASGGELLADDRRRDAACLVIDQHMAELDGLSTLAALRREGATVPAILITGRLNAGITSRVEALGVVTVLEKPFPTSRLVDLVRTYLEARQ